MGRLHWVLRIFLFGAYGLLAHLYPVVLLHLTPVPIDLVKRYQLRFQK